MAVVAARIRFGSRREEGGIATLPGAARQKATMPTSAPADPPADLALPSLDLRALARRAAVPAALAAAVVLALVVAGGPLQAFADALRRALDADPRWVAAGAAFELLSFGGYIVLLWLVGFGASAQITLGGAAATRLLPTGGVGGAALTLWALRRTGLGTRGATRMLLAFLVVLYSVFLASIAVAGGAIALGLVPADGPLALSAIPAAAATLAIVGALSLASRSRARAATPATAAPASSRFGRVRAALRDTPEALGLAVRDALALVRSADPRLLGAIAWWGFDGGVLWAMLHAFGAPPALAVVVLAYFVGQVANTIPVPGAVSGGMVGVLLAFGVQADLAVASVLAYRAIAIWLPAPIGLAALGGLRRTLARWSAEDEPAAASRPEPARKLPVRPLPEPAMQAAA
jgi:uncharacterized membrane protein YbhN (UPF0104 family)